MAWALALSAVRAQEARRAVDVPNPRSTHGGWISDPSAALGAASAQLERRLSELKQASGAEVAIAIVPSIGAAVPREFATALFEHWKIGRQGHDDGVLVLHVLDQRRLEIEVGYGLESALPDVKCAWLVDEAALPHFRAGELGLGHAALLRGIEYAIRHPDATRAQLLAGVGAESAQAGKSVRVGGVARQPLAKLLGPFVLELAFAALFALIAAVLRVRADRSLYREPKRRPPAPWLGSAMGALSTGMLLFAAYMAELPALVWAAIGCLASVGGLVGLGALRTWREAKRRYAPRTCATCGASLTLLSDAKDDRYLKPGQRIEERLRSTDYLVWKCACGAIHIEHYADSGSATRSVPCGYQTEQLKSERVVRPATEQSTGLSEKSYHCAHCKTQRVEKVELPRIVRQSPSREHRTSSSRSGGSFGGGRSGGGGAGGSY
jgi:uncharacterized protein